MLGTYGRCLGEIGVGMKIETYNYDCDLPNSVYWIATVMKIYGSCIS